MVQSLENNITQYGLQVQHVLEDELGPGFSYSVGLFKSYGHAEIIIVGLKQNLAHTLINNMANDIKEGKVFAALTYEEDIIDDFNCYIIEVDKENYDSYVGQAQNYYGGDDFPLIQCIYPTVQGIYPWEDKWPKEIKDLQPILGSINI
ncbi:DUF4262 domain-containing protein [Mucilaginibacter terrigena]|uniref:DUF4262 domain-containing protein n=1 Tax=Mucilaginibacter terrigena TaxID=2492395 RepID=A0A4Q5LHW5_9SPHI|nr:DUF4262 domain-containing protein [Mucilaginibacter terrigena]RYU87246.1 DUF4262 domain-containing protein [Mucilaginibacter terrigena]